jgi:hypothetical protein
MAVRKIRMNEDLSNNKEKALLSFIKKFFDGFRGEIKVDSVYCLLLSSKDGSELGESAIQNYDEYVSDITYLFDDNYNYNVVLKDICNFIEDDINSLNSNIRVPEGYIYENLQIWDSGIAIVIPCTYPKYDADEITNDNFDEYTIDIDDLLYGGDVDIYYDPTGNVKFSAYYTFKLGSKELDGKDLELITGIIY